VRETHVDQILSHATSLRPEILVVNTIQAVTAENIKAPPGTAPQIQECAERLNNFAKSTGTCVILVHCADTVPAKLKHLVDVLLSLKVSDVNPALHYLSAPEKNRFGPTVKAVCLVMRDEGLYPASNAW
jgi:DNA repair protein RadA/Sms